MRISFQAGSAPVLALLSSALLSLMPAVPALAAEPPVYNFSPVNQYNLQVSASFWNPIVRYVSHKSGVRLNLKLGRTSADTTSYVLAREVDFAFTNHLFSPERAKMGWTVFGRRDAAPVRAQIVVPADSRVTKLADLADSTVVFPGPEALIAYKVTYAQLLREKIPVTVAFAGNMDAAFTQLFSGRARAAGANSQLVQNYAGRENKAFRVLWSSVPFNDLALMASNRVPPAQVRAVAQAFLGMAQDPEGRRVLQAVSELVHEREPVRFVAATDADYAAYHQFYEAAPAALR
jgi:phosphonate transport system substrate-binding protein